jgi:hypothetical protein
MIAAILSAAAVAAPVAGCGPAVRPAAGVPAFIAAEIESDASGRCFGRDVSPATIETVTAQELERPARLAPDGRVLEPAVYRSVIRQQIVRERREQRFETLCPPAYTPDFVASLQRALLVRGFYRGAITGTFDAATGRAVQDFQRDSGPHSPLLSIAAARRLGLVVLSAEELAAL